MEERRKTIAVQCYPYGELIYVVKQIVQMNEFDEVLLKNRMEFASMKETNLTSANGTNLNEWKWNYLYDTLPPKSEEPMATNDARKQAKDAMKNNTNHDSLPSEHSFFTDFNEFSLSLLKKENFSQNALNIKETDLLGLEDCSELGHFEFNDNIESDVENIRETDLIGSDDEFTDVSSLSSMTTNNTVSMSKLNGSVFSIPNETAEEREEEFRKTHSNEKNESDNVNNNDGKENNGDALIKFHELESDYFETDCETMDSGIFPHKDAEYFQDIGSDFFDDDEDGADVIPKADSTIGNNNKEVSNGDINIEDSSPPSSPQSTLPPGKTATMSNSLLRSTISELERALNDSNKLLTRRDEKIQRIRLRNVELKKTLSKEVEDNTRMKHLLIEKDKIILEKQSKIIELNQEIHDINDKLSKIRLDRLDESHASVNTIEIIHSVNDNLPPKEVATSTPNKTLRTPDNDLTENISTANTPLCVSNKRVSSRFNDLSINETDDSKEHSLLTISSEFDHNGGSKSNASEDTEKKIEEKVKGDTSEIKKSVERQADLRMKFMRDAFFYYMIGFHPDEQINAILAILEYGDRRQDFVLEAHNMKKLGKKFNVSKVSSRGHSFVQEEFQ